MIRFVRFVALVTLLMLFIMPFGTAAGSTIHKSRPGVLVDASTTAAPTLDPDFSTTTVTREIAVHVFDTLVTFNEHFALSPDLALSWKPSHHFHVWTFQLAKGIKFQNGKTMTSADVVASVHRYIVNGVGGASLKDVTKLQPVGKYAVRFTLSDSAPNFLIQLANPLTFMGIMPKAEAQSTTSLNPPHLIGTGPYKIAKWIPDQYTELTAWKGYTPPSKVKATGLTGNRRAAIKTIRFDVVGVDQSRLNGLTTGAYQYAESLPYASYSTLHRTSGLRPYVISEYFKPVFQINKWKAPLNNVWLRRALAAALDYTAILKFITHNNPHFYRADPSMFFPAQKQWYDPKAGKGIYDHPDKALVQQYLRKANYHGEQLLLSANQQYFWMYDEALAAANEWQQDGINVKLNLMTWPAEVALNQKHDGWDLSTTGYSPRFDPSFYDVNFLPDGSNSFGFNSPQFNKLMKQGIESASLKTRKKVYNKIQDLLWKQVPYIQVGDIMSLDGGTTKLTGYRPWYIPRFWMVH